MRITEVHAESVRRPGGSGPSWLGEAIIANPMSIYPQYKARRSSWTAPWPDVWVEILTDTGLVGAGLTIGGEATMAIILQHFRRLLIDQDPVDIERLWDQLYRVSLPYGRKGLALFAISAVDMALWDLFGKAVNRPVYELLGGSTRESIPVYQTTNDPADWAESAQGGIKLAMPFGPADGVGGLDQNTALIRRCRDVIGPGRDIMLDCYMAWDVEYTRRMIDRIAALGVRWIEEPLPPDDYHGYEALGRWGGPVAIATGEHEYTRWGFRDLIATGGVQILQPDLAWVGGISEGRRICQLASAYHLTVVPHAGGLQAAALHLIKSQTNTPFAEWVRTWDRAHGKPMPAIIGVPDPEHGWINPPPGPGLGMAYVRTTGTDGANDAN